MLLPNKDVKSRGKPGIRKEKRANGKIRLLVFMFNIRHTKSEAGKLRWRTKREKAKVGERRNNRNRQQVQRNPSLAARRNFEPFVWQTAAGGVP